MKNLRGLIKNLIKILDKQIITENTFVKILDDYHGFDKNPAVKKVLKAIISRKYASLIIDLSTSKCDLMRVKEYAHELAESDGFQTDLVETVMRMLVFVCNEQEEKSHDYYIEKRDNNYGCVDSSGKILIPFEYDKMWDFESEYGTHIACVKNFEAGHVYTETGELVFSGEATFNLTNDKALWIVKKDNKYGAIHPNGEVVVPLIYKNLHTVKSQQDNSNLLVVETDSGTGLIDYNGKQILPPIFVDICHQVDDKFDILEAELACRYIYFHSDGSVAQLDALFCTTPLTEETYNSNDFKKPMGFVVNNEKPVVCTTKSDITDLNGNIICSIGKFNNGLAVARLSPWIGYMNTSLEFVIREFRDSKQAKFDFCEPFSNGLAVVWKEDKRGVIDTSGKIIASIQYQNIVRREWCVLLRYTEKYVRTYFNGQYGVGDCYLLSYKDYSDFSCIVNGIYDVGNFKEGHAFAQYKNFVGIVTPKGGSIEPIEYEWIPEHFSANLEDSSVLTPVRRNGVWGNLYLAKGFIPLEDSKQEIYEQWYMNKYKENDSPIPYFFEYQKDNTPCGFNWNNLFYIPVAKYTDFRHLSNAMTDQQQLDWLRTNGVSSVNA